MTAERLAGALRRAIPPARRALAALIVIAAAAAICGFLLVFFRGPAYIQDILDTFGTFTPDEERLADLVTWAHRRGDAAITAVMPVALAAVGLAAFVAPPRPRRSPGVPRARRAVAWPALLLFAALRLGIHVYQSLAVPDGFDMDELHLLDSVDHLAWGFVDHPPLSVALLRLAVDLLGESVLAVRVLPAFFGAGTVVAGGLLARALGGGAGAQTLAAAATACGAYLVRTAGYYSMNALDVLVWSAALLVVARLCRGRASLRLWALLGAILAAGLLNKLSVLLLGAGLAAGILLARPRWLATPGPYLAAAIALLGLLPYLLWNAAHGFPTFAFIENSAALAQDQDIAALAEAQVAAMGEPLALLAAAGAAGLLLLPALAPYRLLGWLWIAVHAIVFASGEAQPHYLLPLHPLAFAAGAVALAWAGGAAARVARRPLFRALPAAATVAVLTGSSVWVVPPLVNRDIQRAGDDLRRAAVAVVRQVARAYRSLPEATRRRVTIYSPTYGFAAAINVYGASYGLPRAIGPHNSYWMWGPGDRSGEVVLSVGPDDLMAYYLRVTSLGAVRCGDCGAEGLELFLLEKPRLPLAKVWPRIKLFAP